ncbi:hypothetical protein [Granulicella sibirica]|uniref:Uncharacterized protein n=1 Tax=Granulicella sibirica TaxID=2479048 RepID=A0A4Q0SY26_9BACT|nr:hypothetical protein [Granulicella sibirica]RXH54379.1 hypothetical protein GRAN_4675 [Granulicella sibirica]
MIYCSPAGATEPEIGQEDSFATLEELSAALDVAGINPGRYGPTIRAARDGYGAGFLVTPEEAQKLELIDENETRRQLPSGQNYRRVR